MWIKARQGDVTRQGLPRRAVLRRARRNLPWLAVPRRSPHLLPPPARCWGWRFGMGSPDGIWVAAGGLAPEILGNGFWEAEARAWIKERRGGVTAPCIPVPCISPTRCGAPRYDMPCLPYSAVAGGARPGPTLPRCALPCPAMPYGAACPTCWGWRFGMGSSDGVWLAAGGASIGRFSGMGDVRGKSACGSQCGDAD
jgi:hypothetical protein